MKIVLLQSNSKFQYDCNIYMNVLLCVAMIYNAARSVSKHVKIESTVLDLSLTEIDAAGSRDVA